MDFDIYTALVTTGIGTTALLVQSLAAWIKDRINYRLERKPELTNLQIRKDTAFAETLELERDRKRAEYEVFLSSQRQTSELESIRDQMHKSLEQIPVSTSIDEALALSCVASSTQPTTRCTSFSDSVGDILLTFTGGKANKVYGPFSLHLTLNVNCTNRVLLTQELDTELASQLQFHSRPIRGRLTANNRVSFHDFVITAPGGVGSSQYIIRGLRANISQSDYGILPRKQSPTSGSVFGFVSIESHEATATRPFMTNDLIVLSRPILGHIVTPSPLLTLQTPMRGTTRDQRATSGKPQQPTPNLWMRVSEGFPGAFKSHNEETGRDSISTADSGTRFLMRFYSVPEGVEIYVLSTDLEIPTARPSAPQSIDDKGNNAYRASFVIGADPSGAGGRLSETDFHVSDPPRLVPVHTTGGFGYAVWEWVSSAPVGSTPRTVNLAALCRLKPTGPRAVNCTSQWSCTVAPVSTVSIAGTAPIPRFLDISGHPVTFLSVIGEVSEDL